MLFTRETDYAIRFFRTLQDGKLHPVSEITEREMVPQQYAYKILRKISKAGLVQVTRGAKGGCRLAVDLDSVSLYDIISIIEGSGTFIACTEDSYECPWRVKHGDCRVHRNLSVLELGLVDALKSRSVKDMLEGEIDVDLAAALNS